MHNRELMLALKCWQRASQDREDRQGREGREADVILIYCSLLTLNTADDVNLKKVSEPKK